MPDDNPGNEGDKTSGAVFDAEGGTADVPSSGDQHHVAEDGAGFSSFVVELKRRKVFRVAATYAVVAWVVIQVAVTTFPSLFVPDWVLRLLIVCAIVGFPLALLLAWVFELTSKGVKVTEALSGIRGQRPGAFARGHKWHWYNVVFSVALPAVIVGVVAILLYLQLSHLSFDESADVALWNPDWIPRFSNPQQVSASAAVEDYPAISADGRTVAYGSNDGGKWNVRVGKAGVGSSSNWTEDIAGNCRYPSWSPDDRWIAFWSDIDGGGYHIIPAFGGKPQKVVTTSHAAMPNFGPAAWSRDGTRLAVVQYKPKADDFEPVLEIIDLHTEESQEMVLPGEQEARLDLALSPNDLFLAYIDAAQQPAETAALCVLRLSDGEVSAVTTANDNVRNPVWLPDSRGLIFTSNRSGPSDFWMIGINGDGKPVGEPMQVTTAMDIRHASFTPDGKTMAYSKGRRVSNIWRVPILKDRLATWDDAEQITDDNAFIEFISLSPDGKKLAFNSDRLGNQELWILPVGEKEPTRLTSHPAQDWCPMWSPDGESIAFYSNRSGNRDIWVMPAAGGAARQLTFTPELEAAPQWSPDGRELTFRSERSGNSEMWVVSVDGKEERQITDDPSGDYVGLFSPDGEWIYYLSLRSGQMQVWRSPSGGGEAQVVTEPGIAGLMCWSPDGSTLYIGSWGDTHGNIWAHSIAERRSYRVTDFSGRRGDFDYQAVATDGEYLYFTWRQDLGDIWVMDVSWE